MSGPCGSDCNDFDDVPPAGYRYCQRCGQCARETEFDGEQDGICEDCQDEQEAE